ncbi:MAG: hypothetical protein II740_07260 [Lachnospiraceae bacterium]|nr:hypothetical protein [Lachnospiraceae bacterium]
MNLDNILDAIEDTTAKAISKGRTTKEVIKLKTEVKACEELINSLYASIGRKYFEMHKEDGGDEEFAKKITQIKNAKAAIEDLKKKIEDIKNN